MKTDNNKVTLQEFSDLAVGLAKAHYDLDLREMSKDDIINLINILSSALYSRNLKQEVLK